MRPNSLSKENDRKIRDFIWEIYLYLAAEHDGTYINPHNHFLQIFEFLKN